MAKTSQFSVTGIHLGFSLLLCCVTVQLSFAQRDSLGLPKGAQNIELIEDFIQNNGEESDFDFNTLFESLEFYAQKPLNLNKATREDLEELRLLTSIQINNLLNYRQELGDLISIHELQAIPRFDLAAIQRILPYVRVKGGLDDYQLPIGQMLYKGKNELYLRWRRTLEAQRGFNPTPEDLLRNRQYQGDENKYYVRFRHTYENRLSYGLTAEKDEGEDFFTGSNPQGFDFYSAHLALKNISQVVKDVVIGDYTISLGQGIMLYAGFGNGKGSDVMNIKRSQRNIKPYTSVNEADFMRGAAATLSFGPNLELTTFASLRQRDANLGAPDTTEVDNEAQFFTSLQNTGLHRTLSEIEDENAIEQLSLGGSLEYHRNNWHIALNGLYNRLDKELERDVQPHNQFFFSGDRLVNFSVDYAYIYQNFNFFGETAISDNGRMATLNGLLISLDRQIDLSLLHRYFPKDYQAIDPDPFAETTGARNENGLYLGLEVRPSSRWRLTSYFDLYQHPWLRFNADAPSRGYDFLSRLTYYEKRKLEVYLQVRYENKEENAPENSTKTNFLSNRQLFQTRLQVANKISKSIELRSRVDFGFADDGANPREYGFSVLQDVIFKPLRFPLSFTTRFALYDTDGFNVRFYHYENDLLYVFTVPPYYNQGTRFYLNLRYTGIRGITLEARYAQTYWSNQDGFGSGLQRIEGSTRSEVKAQIRFSF
ncbi:MAG: helix-hairpin-helix domain-containing protein [Bacteroidota bacterium]